MDNKLKFPSLELGDFVVTSAAISSLQLMQAGFH